MQMMRMLERFGDDAQRFLALFAILRATKADAYSIRRIAIGRKRGTGNGRDALVAQLQRQLG